jgi:delta1-piperideine-2-carboxylate reductase
LYADGVDERKSLRAWRALSLLAGQGDRISEEARLSWRQAVMMRLTISQAHRLVERVMAALGHDEVDSRLVADHLVDCELRGLGSGGLARAISIAERLADTGDQRRAMRVVHETPVSARIDGGDHLGYVVAHHATTLAVEKAEAAGIAVVGVSDTWYTGMLSYYAEIAASRGLVSMIASNASAWVAPYGATEGRFGTNPICFGFPSADDPVIYDIGTSAVIHAEVVLARRLGEDLPGNVAFDSEGRPTRDPAAALAGAFAAWGGPRGSGLGIVVQLLGIMAGSPPIPPELAEFGFVIVAMRPDLMGPDEVFRANVSAYARAVRSARPLAGGAPVRMPFDRSRAERQRRREENAIEVPDDVIAGLNAIIKREAGLEL